MTTQDFNEGDDFPSFEDEDNDSSGMTVAEIYTELLLKEDIILRIQEDDVDELRTALTNHKAKEIGRLKADKIPYEDFQLQYIVNKVDGKVFSLRITMKKKKTFKVAVIEPSEF